VARSALGLTAHGHGPWGINVNAICPGLTLTDAAKKIARRDDGHVPMFTP
jgi:NAD(P)-dependent dehydrogenase (short-subunit alcohol dehydrogenase family)